MDQDYTAIRIAMVLLTLFLLAIWALNGFDSDSLFL